MSVDVGFTGSRKGVTAEQILVLIDLFKELNPHTFHHGDCVGADQYAHSAAINQGLITIIHPPKSNRYRAWCKIPKNNTGYILAPKEYLVRNHNIVDDCEIIIAMSYSYQEVLRSGTWATIRYARKVGKEVFIIYPDGNIEG